MTMNRNLSDILLEPVITEKSTALAKHKKYTFKVAGGVTKYSIKQAFEQIFPGRKVLDINSLVIKGHTKRTRTGIKFPKDSRKAVITIDGPAIEYFPDVS